MTSAIRLGIILFGLMVSASALTHAITPSSKMADTQAKFNLESMIPKEFGVWRVDPNIVPLQVDPETQAKLDRIYNQTLSRTYVNRDGERIMLSLAYGGDQSDSTGLHRPEVCYAAQGFDVSKNEGASLQTPFGVLPIRRLMAISGARHEPITYWVTVGDRAVQAGLEQKMQQLRLGLSGTIPDGMLVRVSSISAVSQDAYKIQDEFVFALLAAVNPQQRERLVGAFPL